MFRELSSLIQKNGLLKKTFVWTLLLTLFSVSLIPTTTKAELNDRQEKHPNNSILATSKTIWVPDNYTKIQWAINNASKGDTIRVRAGTYNEDVVVNKAVSIRGENKDTTILEGTGTLFYVNADSITISDFTLRNGYSGIWLWHTKNTTIRGNNINNNAYGIKSDYSSNSTISENNINNSEWFSIVLNHSGNNTLQRNHIVGTNYNLRVDGDSLSDFVSNIDTTNTVNGKPVYYLINQRDLTIDSSTLPSIGYLALVNSTNITVKNLNLMYSGQGILFAHTTNSIIRNLTTTSNWNGIEVNAASNVTVIGNNANGNFDFGIKFMHSCNSTVSRNNANYNGWAGIGIFTSQNCTVDSNIVNGNVNYGIDLVYSTSNRVTRNNAAGTMAAYSIVIYYSNFNLIYHNNFISNYIFKDVKTTNTWDNGLEGNYWRNHLGVDTNQDGISEIPYILEEGNQDNHPLMGMFHSFSTSIGYNVDLISNSTIDDFGYFQSNKTIRMHVSNMTQSQTFGFVRIRIPHVLMNEPYNVTIDGAEPYYVNYTLYDDGENRWIYFSYEHSTREILIVPEFPSFIIIPPFMIATLLAVIVCGRKRRSTRNPTKITKNQLQKF